MIRSVLDTLRRRRLIAREEGMTMIEVVVAAMILALGSLAMFSLITTQAHNTYRGEQSQVVSNRLQEEMEKIKALPYSQIALTGLPTDVADTADPRWRTAGTNFAVARDGSQLRQLVYNGSALVGGGTVSGGMVSPTPEPFGGSASGQGDVTGKIYRFVTWENDPSCPESSCPGAQDLKRVIVAIGVDNTAAGGTRTYQELQSQISDPNAQVSGPQNNPDDTGGKPWTFFLTDTPCNNSDRQALTGDHFTHNTNGACSTGKRDANDCTTVPLLGTNCPVGAPDLMVTHAPPLTGESPLWDYASDVEPSTNATQDKGLQELKPSSSGCVDSLFQVATNVTGALLGDSSPTRSQNVHKWVSNPMGNGFNVILDGRGTLNLWTKTTNGQTYTGKICIWLFERHLNLLNVPVDTPAVNVDVLGPNCQPPVQLLGCPTSFTYQPAAGVWPQNWTELHIPLHFNVGLNLGPQSRLGLAIQVERSGTSCTAPCGLEFMYDEPSFDSRLELSTTSLLPF